MTDMNDENPGVDKKLVIVDFGYAGSKSTYRNSVHFRSMKSAKSFIRNLENLIRVSADAPFPPKLKKVFG